MSASLVGSEMCIRDRSALSACCEKRRTAQIKRRKGAGKRRTVHRTALRSCLLYTSDAADDM
eukprot:10557749-Alexandrium_andersonii.AAC.1